LLDMLARFAASVYRLLSVMR
jgi:hypothetical protein